jgi:hypothetical protein
VPIPEEECEEEDAIMPNHIQPNPPNFAVPRASLTNGILTDDIHPQIQHRRVVVAGKIDASPQPFK